MSCYKSEGGRRGGSLPTLQSDVAPRTVFHKEYRSGVSTPEKVILLEIGDTGLGRDTYNER